MKLAFITAGAGGMFCGSCMKDNTLAAELIRQGHDTLLIPTYTPITTDEADVSSGPIQFGGINVFLQQQFALFRHTPEWFDRLLNFKPLLRFASRFAVSTKAADLGDLTLSMLRGTEGKQRKELKKFLRYLKEDVKPDVVLLTNVLLSGLAPSIRKELKVPVWAILQGDDIFLEMLPHEHRDPCLAAIRTNAESLAGLISVSRYYADFMLGYLGLPPRVVKVVYPGIALKGFGDPRPEREGPPTIGYFARICPEKGLQNLVDAFILFRQMPGAPECKLRISGWLGSNQREFLHAQFDKLRTAGLDDAASHVEARTHREKISFFQGIDILSVPTSYHEPKGIYILEALASGVPVVQPAHGSFPELIEATGGGLTVKPDDAAALAEGLFRLATDAGLRREMGERGRKAVFEKFTAAAMAAQTMKAIDFD